jgi:Domain of unknown function (DUF1707)/Cell wall-active antibiotics response 4TMS YvqF
LPEGDDRTPALRASDAERERAVATMRDAAGQGRLTFEELAQRTELAYDATTGAELERLVADLPATARDAGVAGPPPRKRRRWNVAVLSSCERKGRWRPARSSVAVAVLGGTELDLRDAVIEGDELVITAVAVLGGIEITVPEGVEVDVSGFAVLGANEHEQGAEPVRPGTPVVRVRAYSVLGGINVTVAPGGTPRGELPPG